MLRLINTICLSLSLTLACLQAFASPNSLSLRPLYSPAENARAEKRGVFYGAELGGGAGTAGSLPFWLYSNTNGRLRSDSYLWGSFSLATPWQHSDPKKFDYTFGFEGTAALGRDKNHIMVDQLWGSVRYKAIVLDVGIVHPDIQYSGLSSTNGNFLFSGNARSLPGINLRTWDFIRLCRWLSLKASYGEYMMVDHRNEPRTRVHHKSLELRFDLTQRFELEIGFDHYAQWGGTSPRYGKLPSGFKDYVRTVLVRQGGENANEGEQINKLGNHIGREIVRLNYKGDGWRTSLYFQNLFEDGSGMRFQNAPDGLYGLYFTKDRGARWFKSALFEFGYTKWQSGRSHNDPVTGKVVGGNDSYLNNYVYHSAWTNYGLCMASPFFTPATPNADGVTMGVVNNRFVAYHLGVCGELPAGIEYRLLASYSRNYGQRSELFKDALGNPECRQQTSLALEFVTPEFRRFPLRVALDLGYDHGKMCRQDNFGVMIRFIKSGWF